MANSVDLSDFLQKSNRLIQSMIRQRPKTLLEVGAEILRLGTFEVPHDEGLLQSSGTVEPDGDDAIVGYNKVYAARLHEHPEYNFQKNRKAKYLEDPIKNNIGHLRDYMAESLQEVMK